MKTSSRHRADRFQRAVSWTAFCRAVAVGVLFLVASNPAGAGPTWTRLDYHGRGARSIALDPQTSTVGYADRTSGGPWKSTDGGRTWKEIKVPSQGGSAVCIALAPGNPLESLTE